MHARLNFKISYNTLFEILAIISLLPAFREIRYDEFVFAAAANRRR